jgi:hypothetical protein
MKSAEIAALPMARERAGLQYPAHWRELCAVLEGVRQLDGVTAMGEAACALLADLETWLDVSGSSVKIERHV